MIHAPARITVPAGTAVDDLVDVIYADVDESGIRVDFCGPELYTHLHTHLDRVLDGARLAAPVEVGLTRDGNVRIHTDATTSTEG